MAKLECVKCKSVLRSIWIKDDICAGCRNPGSIVTSIQRAWRRDDLFNYTGSYEDFPEGSNRYYAQLAVDYHGSAVRDNCISQLIAIGNALDKAGNYCPE